MADGYGLDGPGDRIPLGGGRFSAHVQTGPWAHSASYTMGTGSFSGVKWPGRGVDHPPPSSAEFKERVNLYMYSPSGPSWPILGVKLAQSQPLTNRARVHLSGTLFKSCGCKRHSNETVFILNQFIKTEHRRTTHTQPLQPIPLLTIPRYSYKVKKGKGHPCTGTEALYRPYGP